MDLKGALGLIQDQTLSFDRNIFRTGDKLKRSADVLEDVWKVFRSHAAGEDGNVLRTRETAAMLATARWSVLSALARDESRGMHQRDDRPDSDARFNRRIVVGGLDTLYTATDGDQPLELAS